MQLNNVTSALLLASLALTGVSGCGCPEGFLDGNGQWFDHDCNVHYADEHGPIHALCQADQ